MNEGLQTMLAEITGSEAVAGKVAFAQQKDGAKDEKGTSAAEQFLMLFNNSMVKDFAPENLKISKSSSAFDMAFENKAAAAEKRDSSLETGKKSDSLSEKADRGEKREPVEIRSRYDREEKQEVRTERGAEDKSAKKEAVTDKGETARSESDSEKPEKAEKSANSAKQDGGKATDSQKNSTGETRAQLQTPEANQKTTEADKSGVNEAKASERSAGAEKTQNRQQAVQDAVRQSMFERRDAAENTEKGKDLGEAKQSRLSAAIANASSKSDGSKSGLTTETNAESLARANAAEGNQARSGQNPMGSNGQGNQQAAMEQMMAKTTKAATQTASKGGADFSANLKSSAAQAAKAGTANQTAAAQGNMKNVKGNSAAAKAEHTERLVRNRQTQIIKQVVRSARMTLQNGKQEMKMMLKPEDLGWLKIRMSVEGQKVTAIITAENDHVKGMLEKNINQLHSALQNSNLRVNQISVEVSGQENAQFNMNREGEDMLNQQHQSSDNHRGHGSGSNGEALEEEETLLAETEPSQATLQAGAPGVDMTI